MGEKISAMKMWILSVLLVPLVLSADKPYVTCELMGQLGNQFFQVAVTLSHAYDHDAEPLFPEFKTRYDFGIHENYQKIFYCLNTSDLPSFPALHYRERSHAYQELPYEPNMKLQGFFQSEKYFYKYRDEIVALFQPSQEIREEMKQYQELLDHPHTVAVHLRTYSGEDSYQFLYRCDRKYFKEAMSFFPEETLFVVFSDDMKKCRELFDKIDRPKVYVHNKSHVLDFYLISSCKHQIISNSTFSWWAAYLNTNPDKVVVAPRYWYTKKSRLEDRDVVPEGWFVIDNR